MQFGNSLLLSITGPCWRLLARWCERKGLGALAETCYRNGACSGRHVHIEASLRLVQMLLTRGRFSEALDICEKGVGAHPSNARLWCSLGAVQRHMARMDAARKSYERAVELEPRYAQAWSNLGEWCLVKGDYKAAVMHVERALAIEPKLLQALNNRVAILYELGKYEEAEAAAEAAIREYPNEAALHANLGNVLLHSGKSRKAVAAFQAALVYDPACPEAQRGLATLLGESHRLADTISHIEQEIAVKGESAQRLAALAHAYHAKGDTKTAEETAQRVLKLQPSNVSALITLGACYAARADHRAAIEMNRRALEQNPDMPGIFSSIAFAATYLPDLSPEELYAYHREWAERFELPRSAEMFAHAPARTMGGKRPLRIGYVSGDFGRHPVGFLLRDVLRQHNKGEFEVYCYSMMRNSDEITEDLRKHSNVWVDALFLSDEELATRIHDDRIDVLVDLSGHTAYNRLAVFTRKPAPVQVTWIGYFHSTGLSSIDYYITDPYTTPQGAPQIFSETPVWLPHSRFLYSPPPYAPDTAPTPVEERKHITFGCFNRADKLVEPVIATWSEILHAVPDAILLLKAGELDDDEVREKIRARFASYGISSERLQMRGRSSHQEMLAEYGDIDIALDPFPFNGGMTTLEALWMGVPLVALAGTSIVARQSTSVLINMGLPELVFEDRDAYVAGAVALANDRERLMKLRGEIRKRLANSPICKPVQFTAELEALYRKMWEAFCEGGKLDAYTSVESAAPTVHAVRVHGNANGKIRLVCATRGSEQSFFKSTALGRSFSVHRHATPNLELLLFPENCTGLPVLYNTAIEEAKADPAILVFVHDDVVLADLDWAEQLNEGLSRFDLIGVVGNVRRAERQPAWCFIDDGFRWDAKENLSGFIGHGRGLPCEAIDFFGPSKLECKLLDGVLLAAYSKTLIDAALQFDPNLAFHFYDMDLCRQAEIRRLRMGTWPISIVHESPGSFGSDSWRRAYDYYLHKYGE